MFLNINSLSAIFFLYTISSCAVAESKKSVAVICGVVITKGRGGHLIPAIPQGQFLIECWNVCVPPLIEKSQCNLSYYVAYNQETKMQAKVYIEPEVRLI